MSWWIIDTVSINEDGDESLCDIQCDTAADLPAADQTGTAGYTIVRGSTALDLATGDRYIMDSSGSWVRQPSQYQLDLSGYATQSWVNGELAGYVPSTTYNTDQAAQDAAIAGKASVSYITIVLAGSPLSASEFDYSAIVTGDILTVNMRIVLNTDLNVNTSLILGQIQSGYWPPQTCAGSGYANNKIRQFWINTNGNVRIRIDELIPAGSSITCSYTYSYKAANWTTITP